MCVNIPNLPQRQSVATTLAKWRLLLQWHANPGYSANACLRCSKNNSSPVRMTQSCQVNKSKLIKVEGQPEGLCNRPKRHVMVYLQNSLNTVHRTWHFFGNLYLLLFSTSYTDCSRQHSITYLISSKRSSNFINYISRSKFQNSMYL